MPMIAEPQIKTHEVVKTQNPWHVILHDDTDHTFEYVIEMLIKVFGKTAENAFQHAEEVNETGRSIVDTTFLERAELKMDQIHSYGPDPRIPRCKGSMSASIEEAS
jgi:ATP-dependent Clp protease adaptor protein ClpS